MWKKQFSNIILKRGQDYYKKGNVEIIEVDEDYIHAEVRSDNSWRIYDVDIEFDYQTNKPQLWCDCQYAYDGNKCKHEAAVMYAIEEQGLHDLNSIKKDEENKVHLFDEESTEQDYQYFDLPSIVEDVNFTEKVVEEAKKSVKSKKVTAEAIDIGYANGFNSDNMQ